MPSARDIPSTGFDEGDALASVRTGVKGHRVMIAGLSASQGDSGSPGPHVVLRGADGEMVFAAGQVAELVEALLLVRDRIEDMCKAQEEEAGQ